MPDADGTGKGHPEKIRGLTGGRMNFEVTFTRTVERSATVFADAPTHAEAEKAARLILTEDDYGDEEIVDEEVLIRQLRSKEE
jgi:hypothetical protein